MFEDRVGAERGAGAPGVALAVVEMVLYGLGLVVLSTAGLLLVMASDSCGSAGECNDGRIVGGVAVSTAVIWVPFVVALIAVIVRARRARTLWWVPLVAGLASCAIFGLGVALVWSGVPQS